MKSVILYIFFLLFFALWKQLLFSNRFSSFLLSLCFLFQVRKLKGSDEHLSVERAGGGQELLVSK